MSFRTNASTSAGVEGTGSSSRTLMMKSVLHVPSALIVIVSPISSLLLMLQLMRPRP